MTSFDMYKCRGKKKQKQKGKSINSDFIKERYIENWKHKALLYACGYLKELIIVIYFDSLRIVRGFVYKLMNYKLTWDYLKFGSWIDRLETLYFSFQHVYRIFL